MLLDSLNAAEGLLPGVFRGIPISIIDVSSDHGRRVLEYLYPGVDPADYDDFGVGPSGISIEALYVGDDYRVRAKLLSKAFETPGSALLIHPWLGPMQVIWEEPAQIRFSERELRVFRVSARFKRAPSSSSSGFSGGLLPSALSSFTSAVTSLATLISSAVISTVRTSASIRSRRVIASMADSIAARPDARSAVSQIRSALAASSPSSPIALNAWASSAASVIAQTIDVPAVAPATTVPPTKPSAQALMSAGLSIATGLLTEAGKAPSAIDALLLAGAAGQFIAASAEQSSYADFVSRQEALRYRAAMTSALVSFIDQVEQQSPDTMQAASSAASSSARSLIAAIVSDLNEVIGRLPSVRRLSVSRDTDAWLIAQHLSGDTPARLEAVYADLVARNDPSHPAQLPAGDVEFLERS
ncbi:DNA circularization N-terminal domain-containing protein [Agrobacterium pusense]|uniref:DNA circularization N-terminal domain-containing protein n=1 Tax=Agrobacterium pusense TaxID=648995 RepID=UPI0032DB9F90